MDTKTLFRSLPNVDDVLADVRIELRCAAIPRSVLLTNTRIILDVGRSAIASGARVVPYTLDEVVEDLIEQVTRAMEPSLRRVVNATGIIVHTNLGRSVLADAAIAAVLEVAAGYSTLEYDVESGERGSRHSHVESLICELTGAEAALAVNNNAAAVMMVIACFSRGKEALVSRGQLVEIGGSFRVPDIMAESGARMVEVGTTNKTHISDYERVISADTGLLLKVHSSNYRVVGFTSEVALEELVDLGARYDIPVVEDQGSGVLIDLRRFGLGYEPTVQESIAAGVTVVTFSGDKLLGGPQAGIICGKADAIARLKKHPMARALRLDKMTLAALEATLGLYRDEDNAIRSIPTLRALTLSYDECAANARDLAERIVSVLGDQATVEVLDTVARAGGGSLPLADIPSVAVAIQMQGRSAAEIERRLRLEGPVSVVARIAEGKVLLDPRTFVGDDTDIVVSRLSALV